MRFFEAKAHGLQAPGNPLFPRKESSKKLWILVGILCLLAVIIAVGAAGVYGPYLSLREVKIEGAVTLSSDDLEAKVREQFSERRFLILPSDHRWFFNPRVSETALFENFPLKSAEIQKQGATLLVAIVEDISMVALRSGDDIYFLDPKGTVIRLAEGPEKAAVLVMIGEADAPGDGQGGLAVIQTDMPVIREKTATVHELGAQLFSESQIDNIIQFSEGLRQLGTRPKEFVSDSPELPWFAVTSDKEYLILFDANESVETQLAVLETVTEEYLATQEGKPRYIDVRFGTRVYIR
jgi:cell division septal protein FtsQ